MREILQDGFQTCIDVRGSAHKSTNQIREFLMKKKSNEIKELL